MIIRNLVSAFIGICIGLPLSLYAHPYTGRVEVSRNIEKPVYEAHSASETYMGNRFDTMVDPSVEMAVEEEPEAVISDDDLHLLACLVHAEAGIEDLHGKQLVVDVVLNRVDSAEFPNSIRDVIFEKNQFSTVTDGALDRAFNEVTQECFDAVEMELNQRTDSEILYFCSTGYLPYGTPKFRHLHHWFSR